MMRVALAPLQEFAQLAQHVVLLHRLSHVRALGRDDERHRVHAEAGHAELDPEAHDLQDLGLHLRIRGVEVGLEIVEAVEVLGASLRCRSVQVVFCTPGNTMPLFACAGFFFDQTYQSRYFESGSRRASWNQGCSFGGVVDHQVDEHADAALLARRA